MIDKVRDAVGRNAALILIVAQGLTLPMLAVVGGIAWSMHGQLSVVISQVADIRQEGYYRQDSATRAHERIETRVDDHEQRLRHLEQVERTSMLTGAYYMQLLRSERRYSIAMRDCLWISGEPVDKSGPSGGIARCG